MNEERKKLKKSEMSDAKIIKKQNDVKEIKKNKAEEKNIQNEVDKKVQEKPKKKAVIFVVSLCIILVIIIVISVLLLQNSTQNNSKNESTGLIDLNNKENVKIEGNQKINISEELKKEKQVEGLKIKDIELKTQSNMTNLIATVENVSAEVFNEKEVQIIFKNQDGSEFAIVKGYIDTIQPGETTIINTYTMADVANAYDFEIQI